MLIRSWPQLRAPRQCQLRVNHVRNHRREPWQHTSRSSFHTTAHRYDDAGMANHYETLDLPIDASPGEIKKQFYKLSKSHHPDLHPNNPTAAQKFVKISEAYATLGSAETRSRYDRDFLRASPSSAGGGPGARAGSYSSASTTPAGGRPASGLSRRRTKFQGPPPSFYRSGGWGAQGAKREEASRESSHTYEAQGTAQSGPAGTGPGGFAQGLDNDVPHFNHRGHFETHSTIERNRQRARGKREVSADSITEFSGNSHLFNFVLFSGMLGIIYGVSALLMGGGFDQGKKQKEKA